MVWLALAAVVATGCRVERQGSGTPREPPRPDYLAGFWFIPGSRVNDTTGTAEAQRIMLTVAMPIDTVRAVYRDRLRSDGWTMVSDVGDSLQAALHARRDTTLVWLMLEHARRGLTNYTVIGTKARPDTSGPVMMPGRR